MDLLLLRGLTLTCDELITLSSVFGDVEAAQKALELLNKKVRAGALDGSHTHTHTHEHADVHHPFFLRELFPM